MSEESKKQTIASSKRLSKYFDVSMTVVLLLFIWVFLFSFNFLPQPTPEKVAQMAPQESVDEIENGIHLRSGLIVDDGYQQVLNNCGACHSYKLVTQNRANAQGWTETIRWMQETQKLWELGENEALIVQYLAKNYGLKKVTRRQQLETVEWYDL